MRGSHAFRLAAVLAVASIAAVPWAVRADTIGVDFESPTYSLGVIDGQDGWSAFGSAGSGCATYDVEVVADPPYASFGDQSLRISNAVTSGCFGDQTFSKPTVDEAGETDATNGGLSGGIRQPSFSSSWDFASAAPGEHQPGSSVVASADRGDGARMTWVQMLDEPDGLAVNFYGYDTTLGGTCSDLTNFVFTEVADGMDPSRPHSIRQDIFFVDGINNDVVHLYVDGVLAHVGTTWEDFFRNCQPPSSRTVDSLLFRVAGTACSPSCAGLGFLIDNVSVSTDLISTSLAADPAILDGLDVKLVEMRATLTTPIGPLAGQTVSFSAGGTPVCSGVTDANGVASCSGLANVVDVVLAGGYDADYAGDATHAPSTASAGLIG